MTTLEYIGARLSVQDGSMRWVRSFGVGVVFVVLAGALTTRAATPAMHKLIENYQGAVTCAGCHSQAVNDVMHTTHWTWTHVDSRTGAVLGKQNVINSYCIAVPSNEPRCTSCHIGVGWKDQSFDFNDVSKVDCLVCHDTTGTYKKTPTGAGQPDPSVNLLYVARNAGATSRATCGACHFYGGGGDAVKHGDLDSSLLTPTRALDVHMGTDGLNFTCTTCHQTRGHVIPGSRYSKPAPDSQLCENCHTAAPHKSNDRLNAHTARVACQTCHVPTFARGGHATKMSWDWSTAGVKNPDGSNKIVKDADGNPVYDTMKGTFEWSANVVPEYVWFNGQVDYVGLDDILDPAQVVTINSLRGDINDPKARIVPVKRFTGVQPFDAGRGTLAIPHLYPSGPTDTDAYWKGYDWDKALKAGMTYAGRDYSGQLGWIKTEMFWIENHMVAPKEQALQCIDCHSPNGRIPFAQLGYDAVRVARLQDLNKLRDHTGLFGANYTGPAACLQCHPGKADEVMGSVHYTWRTPNPKLAYPGGGSHGMLDRFCGLVGSSAMLNYTADFGAHKGSSACGKCHVADQLPFPNPATGQFAQAQKDGLDCLICHASAGNYDMNGDGIYDETDADAAHRRLLTDAATGRRSWFQDRSLRAAESVGQPVGAAQCLRCHEHGQAAADYKRGTPFDPEHDVHAAAGLRCTDCHQTAQHQIARGSRVSDMHAWERQDVEVNCTNCHDATAPHKDAALAAYNDHVSLIACETCHIPWTSGAARRIWASTFGVTEGPEANIPARDPVTGVYEPYSVYSAAYASRPAYRWFNGSESMLAEPINDVNAWDSRVATKDTPGAKIYPFRGIVNGMILDRRGFGYAPDYSSNFTMLAAMDAMAGPLKQMGFMRPEGLTAPERAVLAQFPNLVSFDLEHYFKTGNIREAVNIGLGRMGLMMSGQDAWGTPVDTLNAMGTNFWSGEVLGLDLPNNPMDPTYNPTAPPTEVTGSFISLSHAIKRDGALRCADCHSTAGVMNFKGLSYGPDKAAYLQNLLHTVQFSSAKPTAEGLALRWAGVPGHTYQLQSTTDLQNGSWTPVGPTTNSVGRWLETVIPQSQLGAEPQRFFRVVDAAP